MGDRFRDYFQWTDSHFRVKAAYEFSSSSVVPTYLPTAEGKLESFPEVIPHPVVVVVDDAAADAVTAALVLWIIRVLSVVFYQLWQQKYVI